MTKAAEKIRTYWNHQAELYGADPRATTQDYWMREIEIAACSEILARLPDGARILDIGCGNGFSTIKLLRLHPTHTFVGGDFAPEMIRVADAAAGELPPALRDRLEFSVMDVTDLPSDRFDVVISDRCLINLPDRAAQRRALRAIAGVLDRGGEYIAIENFVGAQAAFNEQRERQGLAPIPVRWHNLFLDEPEFLSWAADWFEQVAQLPISSAYYLVTRVVYSKLCQLEGREPDYDHPIYEIASRLPYVGDYGPIKLVELLRL